jgi:hypothetical protein
MYNITLDQINEVDGGERYMLSIYPELHECFTNPSKKIKLRDDDKTASAGVFRHKKANIWMLHDFGGGGNNKTLTAFNLCQEVNKCDAGEAFKIYAKFYGFDLKVPVAKPQYSSRLPKPGELPKQVINIVYKELEYADVLTVLSKNAWAEIQWNGRYAKDDAERLEFARALFKYYRFKAVHSYEKVKADGSIVHIYTATDSFPIFAIDEGEFQKIYKPRDEKEFRFLWVGNKPESYVHGLAQHKAYIESNIKKNEKRMQDAQEHSEKAADNEEKKEALPEKFKHIIQVSGGSDALNVAAIGYRVIWLNSETAKLDTVVLKSIYKIADEFLNLPDIDSTGRTAAKHLAWNHIDIKTIWLPDELSKKGDGKGGRCKDAKDYLKYWTGKSFNKLVENALPFRFWDQMYAKDKDGRDIFKFGRIKMIYEFNNVRGYNFLQMNGFWRYADEKYKEGYRLIKVEGNMVRDVLANEVKNYIHKFLKERQLSEDLRNVMYRSPQLSESSLSNLDVIDLNFKNYGHDYQYLFFEDRTWKVTTKAIEVTKMPDIYVWDKKILKPKTTNGVVDGFRPTVVEPMFKITNGFSPESRTSPHEQTNGSARTDNKGWDVSFEPSAMECDYLKFTLQTCKIHWRSELEARMEYHELPPAEKNELMENYQLPGEWHEKMMLMDTEENQELYYKKYRFRLDGSLLTPKEIAEQKLAFVNRVFLIGYILHRYKDPTKPWAGFVMDYRISDDGASNGRAGKGLLALGLKQMLDSFRIDARNPKLFDNDFLFGGVNKGNELIHMEDWDEFLDFERIFNALTGSLYSNAKGLQPVNLDNQEFGKFLIDTNFSDRYMSGSAKGRKLWSVFADFYHEDLEYYKEVRTPQTELGQRMFDDWDTEEWNRFYNFMAQCLQFYLSLADKSIKIDPPFANIHKRNSLSIMGENFRQWADTYFADRMNEAVERKAAQEDFVKSNPSLKTSPQNFFKRLMAWADFMNYEFNPEHVQGWQKAGEARKYGYIKRSVASKDSPGKYTTVEYVYIEAKNKPVKTEFDTF